MVTDWVIEAFIAISLVCSVILFLAVAFDWWDRW